MKVKTYTGEAEDFAKSMTGFCAMPPEAQYRTVNRNAKMIWGLQERVRELEEDLRAIYRKGTTQCIVTELEKALEEKDKYDQ